MIVYMAFLFDNKESDLGLQQGADYNKLQHDVIGQQIDFNMKLLEETTMPKIGSIVEGLENSTINDKNNAVSQQMKDLEQEFNEKLSEYTTLYRRYMQNMSSNPSSSSVSSSSTVKSIYAGKNIVNTTNDKKYWVDHDNIMHEWPSRQVFMSLFTTGKCTTRRFIDVTSEDIAGLQTGAPMNEMSSCTSSGPDATSTGTDATWDRITALNDELIGIADKMYQAVTHINSTDEQVDREVKSAGVSLQSRIKQLNDERNKFIQMKSKLQSLEGKYDDSQRNLTSQYTQYMVWSLAAITLGAFAVKYIAKS